MLILYICLSLVEFCNCQKLVIISIDGFSASLLEKTHFPFMHSLLEKSSFSKDVDPVFPSQTFPNHHTISTGLYPNSHGIINNRMVELNAEGNVFGRFFDKDSKDPYWWDQDDNLRPIYIANELAGCERNTSTIYWPGSNVAYARKHVSKFKSKYLDNKGDERLVEAIIDYKSDKYNLIMVYLSDIDEACHNFGPRSRKMKNIYKKIDEWIEKFMSMIDLKRDNVIILGDHGMKSLSESNIIDVENILYGLEVYTTGHGASLGLYPKRFENAIDLTAQLHQLEIKMKEESLTRYKTYRKDNIPAFLNHHNHPRTPPLFLLANRHFYFTYSNNTRKGAHGWTVSTTPEMKTVFIGVGPSFKTHFNLGHMQMTDHYLIFCKILNIMSTCHPSQGSKDLVQKLFATHNNYV